MNFFLTLFVFLHAGPFNNGVRPEPMKKSMSDLQRMSPQEFKEASKMPVIVVLDNIRSQHNVGSVFRTSDAFRVEKILLCGITATPPNKEIQKTALGATETVLWQYYEHTTDALKELKSQGYTLVGVEQTHNSTDIRTRNGFAGSQKTAVVFGNEVFGMSDEALDLCDKTVEIPQFGTKHSLNVSVCAGIIIWELCKWHLDDRSLNP